MPRKSTTRRAVSVKGLTWQWLKNYADANGKSMSGALEEIVAERLDEAGVPVPEKVDGHEPQRSKPVEKIISQHFTF